MILNEGDKCLRGRTESWCAARGYLPKIRLSLKQIAVLGRGNEFLRTAKIVGVVGLSSPGQRDGGAMMKIVVPNCIEVVTAFAARPDEFGNLPLVFRDQNNRAPDGGFARGASNCADDVFVRLLVNRVGGVETKAIEMEFVDPVAAVGDEKFADRCRVRSIEVNRIAPVGFIFANQ